MSLAGTRAKKKWVFYGKWALSPTIVGAAILTFEVVTGAKYAPWLLWFAVPLLMIGLGYIFIINAIAAIITVGEVGESEERNGEEAKK